MSLKDERVKIAADPLVLSLTLHKPMNASLSAFIILESKRTPAYPRVRLVRFGGGTGEPFHFLKLFSPPHGHSLKAGSPAWFAGFSLGGGVLGVLRTASHGFAQRGFLCSVTWLFASKPSGKSHCFLMIFIFEGSKPLCTPT